MLDDFRFGEYTIKLDCDVLVADGGTRTASITGACVAAVDAFDWLVQTGRVAATPVKRRVAAVSVGVIGTTPRLDLDYEEDVARRRRYECCDEQRGRVRRGSGNRRARHVRPSRARRAAGSRGERAPRARPRAAARRLPRHDARGAAGDAKRRKVSRASAALRGARHRGRSISSKRASRETPDEDALEVFATFEENALAKARYFHGVERSVDRSRMIPGSSSSRLAARPGCRSKRWSGRADLSGQALDDENNRLLLERLRG